MKLFVPRETAPGETRVPLTPEAVKKLVGIGIAVDVEAGIGSAIDVADADYEREGATVTVVADRPSAFQQADMVVRLRPPPAEDVALLKKGAIHVSHLDPFQELGIVRALAESHATAICMVLIPRTTLAQKMDALSS